MKKKQGIALVLAMALCLGLFACKSENNKPQNAEHEPLTVMTGAINYSKFEALLREKYPEVRLEFVSYTGSNCTGYNQYLLKNGEVPDLFTVSVFCFSESQKEHLLDLSGYSFLSNYKTADISQVALDGAVYLVPASSTIIGLYYNKTLFAEKHWKVPGTITELRELTETIRAEGIDPVSAQFELSGNGFFDLFTMAKTNFLSTPQGIQWEQDFKDGKATAREGLSEAAKLLQALIDCGFLDAADTTRNYQEAAERFYSREAAMYLNAGTINRFSQNEDGTGDQYGIIPFFGMEESQSVLITLPLSYFGLSKTLGETGNEQKLEDALKVMELLATEEGQQALLPKRDNYVAPLKNETIPEDSPFQEVEATIRSGHTSNLAYAGYEPIIIGVGDKVRDWVRGDCTGEDVLDLIDALQADSLSGTLPPVAVAAENFTMEETAQLEAEAFRQAAGTDLGLVSLGGYHDGYENASGVCGKLFAGEINQDVVNAIVPGLFKDRVCILTLPGAEIRALLETGFVTAEGVEGFPYIPAGLTATMNADGTVRSITLADGSPLDEKASYTVAIDQGGFTEDMGQHGSATETEIVVFEAVGEYLGAHSPLVPLKPSIEKP